MIARVETMPPEEQKRRAALVLHGLAGLVVVILALAAVLIGEMAGARSILVVREMHVLLAGAAVVGGACLFGRRASTSPMGASTATVVAVLAVCWSVTGAAIGSAEAEHPELISLFTAACALTVQAALVPAPTWRSVAVALAALVPLGLASWARFAWLAVPHVGREMLLVVVQCGIATACPAVIAHAVHGAQPPGDGRARLGGYRLAERLGEGAMGVVHRARHELLGRPAAIKIVSDTAPDALARFEREVQATARLRHPGIVTIFDYGRTADARFYYAMELVEGITFDELVRREGPLPLARAVHLLRQVCAALDHAHAAGLVHRDVKPANLMITRAADDGDVVKVLDFGLVKDFAGTPTGASVHAVLGTPDTMAPELIASPGSIDHRVDVYAVGAVAFFLLTGRFPFEGSSFVEVCRAQLFEPPLPPVALRADLPDALEDLVLRCLAKDPAARPASARELDALLAACPVPAWTAADARACWSVAPR